MSKDVKPTAAYPSIEALKPYVTGKPIEELAREKGLAHITKLASNENPLGASAKALEVIRATNLETLSRYPDGGGFTLKTAIAQYHSKEADLNLNQITLGNGSNDLLDLIARTFVSSEEAVVMSEYAFAVYPIVTAAIGAAAQIAEAKDYGHDLDAMLAQITEATRLVFIANPNNPTGTLLSQDEIHRFLTKVPPHVVVVLDEAYTEYKGDFGSGSETSLSWLSEFDNLIITRTFSKAFGLAAMRVGYALSSASLANLINRLRHPFNVSTLSQLAATAALSDTEFLEASADLNLTERSRLEQVLDDLQISYLPSAANFVTLKVPENLYDGDGAKLYEALLNLGVIARPLGGYGMGEWLRVSIGLHEENDHFIRALRALMGLEPEESVDVGLGGWQQAGADVIAAQSDS